MVDVKEIQIGYFLGTEFSQLLKEMYSIQSGLIIKEITDILLLKPESKNGFYTKKDLINILSEHIQRSKTTEVQQKMILYILDAVKCSDTPKIETPVFKEINTYKKIVADYFNIPIETLDIKTREREIVRKRQIAMFFCHAADMGSLDKIGECIGGKDHATVLHSKKTINDLLESRDKETRRHVKDITMILLRNRLLDIQDIEDDTTKANLQKLMQEGF